MRRRSGPALVSIDDSHCASSMRTHRDGAASAALCRYCCKSPKLPDANFPAAKKSNRQPPIDVASITFIEVASELNLQKCKKTFATKSATSRPEQVCVVHRGKM